MLKIKQLNSIISYDWTKIINKNSNIENLDCLTHNEDTQFSKLFIESKPCWKVLKDASVFVQKVMSLYGKELYSMQFIHNLWTWKPHALLNFDFLFKFAANIQISNSDCVAK